MTPSSFQQAIYDFIPNSNRNLIVDAVAGSGKTSTGCGIVERMTPQARRGTRFMAFSKAIATELSERLPAETPASTLHSFGYSACRSGQGYIPKTNKYKYRDYAEAMLPGYGYDETETKQLGAACQSAIDMARLTLCNIEDDTAWYAMLDHYDINEFPELRTITSKAIAMGIDKRKQDFDFTDMLYLPVTLGYAFPHVETLIVDECQDLNNLQRAFIRKVLNGNGRLIAVGDPYQAIFGFAGATVDSVERIRVEFDCETLPLSVCYRCPLKHLDMAREFVPHVLARENAPKGKVLRNAYEKGLDAVTATGDMVMCRNNAPLVSAAFTLLAQGKPVILKDKDLISQITNLAQRAVKGNGRSWSKLSDSLDSYVSEQCDKLRLRKGTDSKINALQDRAEALRIIESNARAESYYITSGKDLDNYIARFTSTAKGSVKLTTIHRAKGLEANRVHILGYGELQPAKYAKLEWEVKQETNLQYVGLTRAKDLLQFITLPPRSERD